MAHLVFVDGKFTWNSVNLSSHVRGGRLRIAERTVEDANFMGATGKKVLPIIGEYELEIEFSQDYASSQVDATVAPDSIHPLTARAWTFKPTSGATGPTNPEYQGTGYITEYEPIAGAFGEVLGSRIRIEPSVAGVTRATA